MISVGIDIGSFSIKVAYVKATPRGFEVLRTEEYPLTQDPTKDNTVDVIEVLRDIKSKLPNEAVQFNVAVRQEEVTLRRRAFPFRERHKILKSLPFELEDDVPLPIEDTIFDAKLTHYQGPNAHVLAVACPKDNIHGVLNKFADGGIYADALGVEGIALSSLFEEWRESPREFPEEDEQKTPEVSPAQAVIHMGHRSTIILILKDGYLLEVRQVDWGGKDVAEEIASKYSIHYLEALKELRKKAFILTNNEGATKEQVALSEIIKGSIDNFVKQLKLIYLEAENNHHLAIQSATTSGGLSRIRNLGPYLTQKTEVATNRLSHFDNIPNIDFASSVNNEIAHILAIGLGVEAIKKPKNPGLNLLKGEFARQSQGFRVFWDKWSHAVQVGAACFVLLLVWSVLRDGFSSDMSARAGDKLREIARAVTGERRVSNIQIRAYIREQEQRTRTRLLMEDLGTLNSGLDIIKSISSIAPTRASGQIKVNELKINSDLVRITGEANQVEVISNFQNSLRNLSVDGVVESSASGLTARPGYRPFGFTLKVSRKTGGSSGP